MYARVYVLSMFVFVDPQLAGKPPASPPPFHPLPLVSRPLPFKPWARSPSATVTGIQPPVGLTILVTVLVFGGCDRHAM